MCKFFIDSNGSFSVDTNTVESIYNKMDDSISRDIFVNRLAVSLTKDPSYFRNVVCSNIDGKVFSEKLSGIKGKVALFGAGFNGSGIKMIYNADYLCYIDNYSNGYEKDGLPVVSFEEFKKNFDSDDVSIVVAITGQYQSVYTQLAENGIKENRIVNSSKMISNLVSQQYFDYFRYASTLAYKDETSPIESFVDAGVYDNTSSYTFAAWCKGNYSNIWAFEPDKECFKYCRDSCSLKNYNIFNCGLSDKKRTVYFSTSHSGTAGGSKVDETGDVAVEVVDLDSVLKDEKVTFIKMDIEGSECDALSGARNIIAAQKPKLAISVYHKAEDIYSIPKLILDLNPDYKFALRHYSLCNADTVLYAF